MSCRRKGTLILPIGRYFLAICAIASHLRLLNSAFSAQSWCPLPPNRSLNTEFKQRINRFWEFEEKTNRWVEISLPYDLISCTNGSCSKVGSIKNWGVKTGGNPETMNQQRNKGIDYRKEMEERFDQVLPVRKRLSITRMSEASIWVTGLSGSIYERLWNGLRWVVAPHELPISAGAAVSVFIINQTILALSEAGMLYQLQLNENSQPIWSEFVLKFEPSIDATEEEPSLTMRIKTGTVSHDGERLFLTTMDGSLLEIMEFQPLRWENHGRPPGGDVSSLADNGILKPSVVFSVSSTGDLYEFDKKTKPSWKKHIWSEASAEAVPLAASIGCTLHGLVGTHSLSCFLDLQDGFLIERRLHKRKWKWMIHGAPKGHQLSAITFIQQNFITEKMLSIFFTTNDGFIFEYQLPKYSGVNREDYIEGLWVNHMHPQHTKIARAVSGAQLQPGRIIFPLDDGRLAELHLSGMGGEGVGPIHQINIRRKGSYKYEWSILDTPESEGWNAEYCTDERGLLNCLAGMNVALADYEAEELGMAAPGRRMQAPTNQHYLSLPNRESMGTIEQNNFLTKSIKTNFRMRVMHPDRSFFLVSDSGQTFEYLYTENIWLWLRHEHPTSMNGALGSYNGSLFLVDVYGSLLIRERIENDLLWINCTSMKKGKQVATGPPWDGIPGKARRVSAEDALFFINKRGRLLQFMVALRKFKWKDCRSPSNTRIAFIVDQEVFRMNIIFVVGRNGRLYQYNKLTELWHEHYQSPHLVLSRSPGTAMRPSLTSLGGSIFMILENGGLVEYHWSSTYGWEWVEHGTPDRGVRLVGALGPCLGDTELFVIGSNGCVYRRHLDERTWKWTNYGYPQLEDPTVAAKVGSIKEQICAPDDHQAPNEKDDHYADNFRKYCNEKVAAVRPIPFSEDSLVFELQDARLAELRRSGQATAGWEWIRIIGTPTSLCLANYWTAVAS
ncbi:uncharacterized protein LOC110037398 [Phalaenopsis equestris]|uniref:uncharacterized protein LOC110037398 n=1 Tax=Phalaenopsis equestris TaxID=78828 RepID=UPI0009E19EDF|nr:uncharacterized protein LOC110037398 [Phalaenopsis equestris]